MNSLIRVMSLGAMQGIQSKTTTTLAQANNNDNACIDPAISSIKWQTYLKPHQQYIIRNL